MQRQIRDNYSTAEKEGAYIFNKNNPTDRNLLRAIHKRYYKQFAKFDRNDPNSVRSTKIYVPIDCKSIGKELNVDPDIVFGRLYYHLDKKHGYENSDGSKVHLFALKAGNDSHAINFPMLSAVLADLEEKQWRFTLPILITSLLSIVALTISIISIVINK